MRFLRQPRLHYTQNNLSIFIFIISSYIQLLRYAPARITPTTTASKRTGKSILRYNIS